MIDMLTSDGSGASFWMEHELPCLREVEIRELATAVYHAIESSQYGEDIDRALKHPVDADRPMLDLTERFGDMRQNAQFVEALMRVSWSMGDQELARTSSIRLATLAFALDSNERLSSRLVAYPIWDLYTSWLTDRLANHELIADEAAAHLDVVRRRASPSPRHVGNLVTISHLAVLAAFPDEVPALTADKLNTYRRLAIAVGDHVHRSVDAAPDHRLDNRVQAGDDWFAMYSMIDDYYEREFDHAGGINATVSLENSWRNKTRALEVALAIYLFADKDGAPPLSMEELVPAYLDAVPRDAFDGQPLRYDPWEPWLRYRLYSVGWDGVDNDGRTHPEHNQRASQAPGSFFGEFQDPTGYDERLDPWAPD